MPLDDLRPRDWNDEPIEKPLVDDLAWVLASTAVGWEPVIGHDLAEAPEVKRVLARYRGWKAAQEALDAIAHHQATEESWDHGGGP